MPEPFALEELDKYICEYIETKRIPSLALVVIKNGQTVWRNTYGYANMLAGIRSDIDTVYCWYSLTKLATASAIMQLCEKGKIALDSPVEDYLPYFSPQFKSTKAKVTVRHLLTHSSGLSDKEWHAAMWYRLSTEPEPDPEIWLKYLLSKYRQLKSEPGEKFSYSNVGYAVLGEVIAKASGKSYKEYMKENILERLGMAHTSFEISKRMGSNVAVGYEKPWSLNAMLLRLIGRGKALNKREDGFVSLKRLYTKAPSYAGLTGCLDDLSRFVIAHNNGGVYEGRRLLSEESVARMKEPQLNSRGEYLRGLGWRVAGNGAGATWVEHKGGGPGFKSEVRIYADGDLGIALLGNRTFESREVVDKISSSSYLLFDRKNS